MANPVALAPAKTAADTGMGGGVQMLTIMPQNFGEVMAFAEKMAESNFVPAHLRKKPGDCMAVCLQALRWGMDPFSVAQKTYFTRDGSPPAYEAQLINAVVYARAPLDGRLDIKWEGQWPNRVCVVTGHIRGDREPKIRRVQAAGITTRNSPLWKTDPDQQLAYYTTRAWARLYTPDVLMGVYSPDDEDMRAERATDITPAAERPAGGKLDALEEMIGMVDGGNAEPPHDAETGEIFPPSDNVGGDVQTSMRTTPAPEQTDESAKAEAWCNEAIRRLDAATSVEAIDNWLTKNKQMLARMRAANDEAAMAVVSAADYRRRQLEPVG